MKGYGSNGQSKDLGDGRCNCPEPVMALRRRSNGWADVLSSSMLGSDIVSLVDVESGVDLPR
jgi:hypothetical protein